MRKLLAPYYFIQDLALKALIKFFLPKHHFKNGDLIFKEGTRTLYEVEHSYYAEDLHPITIVRAYPVGKQPYGIDRFDILEFREFKDSPFKQHNSNASDVAISAQDNQVFAKGVKVRKK